MSPDSNLRVQYGQFSSRGEKSVNEDCLGIRVPEGEVLRNKGVSIVLTDGVSSAERAKEASEICVLSFLSDYYSTPDSWQVKTSVHSVLCSLNRWLYSSGQDFLDERKGFICALGILVIKSQTAHVFHVGDTRVYRLRQGELQQLTNDHSVWSSPKTCHLSRAMGLDVNLDVDYWHGAVERGDLFLCTTDGVHDYLANSAIRRLLNDRSDSLDNLCRLIVETAAANGSDDNLSVQALQVQSLPNPTKKEACDELSQRAFPPVMTKGQRIDSYQVLSVLESSPRSELYLVKDLESEKELVLKAPSVTRVDDPAYIERFVMEEWIGRRLSNPHLVRVIPPRAQPKFLYYLMERLDGITLEEWIVAHPTPDIHAVVEIIEQIILGLRAMHRRETLHQDLKPANILLETNGNVKIIDFGSAFVGGVNEIQTPLEQDGTVATRRYSAPEHRLGQRPTTRTDLFSLALVAYEMLTGGFHAYGDKYEVANGPKELGRLQYVPAHEHNPHIPHWMDFALERALALDPDQRYIALSDFLTDLQKPSAAYMPPARVPFTTEQPLTFWKGVSGILLVLWIVTLMILIANS